MIADLCRSDGQLELIDRWTPFDALCEKEEPDAQRLEGLNLDVVEYTLSMTNESGAALAAKHGITRQAFNSCVVALRERLDFRETQRQRKKPPARVSSGPTANGSLTPSRAVNLAWIIEAERLLETGALEPLKTHLAGIRQRMEGEAE